MGNHFFVIFAVLDVSFDVNWGLNYRFFTFIIIVVVVAVVVVLVYVVVVVVVVVVADGLDQNTYSTLGPVPGWVTVFSRVDHLGAEPGTQAYSA